MPGITRYHVEHPESGFVCGPYDNSAPATTRVNQDRRSLHESIRARAADYVIVATTYEEVGRDVYIPKSWKKGRDAGTR